MWTEVLKKINSRKRESQSKGKNRAIQEKPSQKHQQTGHRASHYIIHTAVVSVRKEQVGKSEESKSRENGRRNSRSRKTFTHEIDYGLLQSLLLGLKESPGKCSILQALCTTVTFF